MYANLKYRNSSTLLEINEGKNNKLRNLVGFTLIELMIVMIIIAILIGLLYAGMMTARDEALTNECANNLRQIGTALHLYAKDHNGQFPVEGGGNSWGDLLYNGGYISGSGVFDCPVHDYAGTPHAPDYWYTNNLTIYDDETTWIVGCYDGAHNGYENKLNVAGRICLRLPGE